MRLSVYHSVQDLDGSYQYHHWCNSISAAKVDTGVKNAEEFISNMQKVFTLEPHTANSKLMQLNFLYNISEMKKEERDNLLTDMCFLAQKKGRQFGPFGKLY